MAVTMTGTMTLTCDTDEEYVKMLAQIQTAGVYSNIVGDPVARTVRFDVSAVV
jgi:hypothetical protein